jgi:protein-S-isoprenylcysteine O-methyltransferase Ste14
LVSDALTAAVAIAASSAAIRYVYWTQYRTRTRGVRAALVSLHFFSVVAIVTSYGWVWWRTYAPDSSARNAIGLTVFGLGSLVFFWSAVVHKTSLVPSDDASLTHVGPYRFVRHPIYAGGLLGALGLFVAAPTVWLAADWLVLLVSMLALIRSEERELRRRMPAYVDYMKRTPGLIPFRLQLAKR